MLYNHLLTRLVNQKTSTSVVDFYGFPTFFLRFPTFSLRIVWISHIFPTSRRGGARHTLLGDEAKAPVFHARPQGTAWYGTFSGNVLEVDLIKLWWLSFNDMDFWISYIYI